MSSLSNASTIIGSPDISLFLVPINNSSSESTNNKTNEFPIHYGLRRHAMHCHDCSTRLKDLSKQVREIANLLMRQKEIVDKVDHLAQAFAYHFEKCSDSEKNRLRALLSHYNDPEKEILWPALNEGHNTGNFHPSLQKSHVEVNCECVSALKLISQEGLLVVNNYIEVADMMDDMKDIENQLHYFDLNGALSEKECEDMVSLCPMKEYIAKLAEHKDLKLQEPIEIVNAFCND
jgi:hypothetical protein